MHDAAGPSPLTRTPEEAAAIIGGDCKPSWLREKARRREIPCTMIAGRYSFTDEQIQVIVKQSARPAGPHQAKRAPARRAEAPAPEPVPEGMERRTRMLKVKVPRRMQDRDLTPDPRAA